MQKDIFIYNKKLFRGLDLKSYFPWDKPRKFDKDKLEACSRFYGYGFYFAPDINYARIWGNFIVEYKYQKKLSL